MKHQCDVTHLLDKLKDDDCGFKFFYYYYKKNTHTGQSLLSQKQQTDCGSAGKRLTSVENLKQTNRY